MSNKVGTILGAGDTIRFGVDGRSYEIDLSDENAAPMREILRPLGEASRRTLPLNSRRRRR